MGKPTRGSQQRNAERLVAVAEIARPHGLRGELRLKIYNPESTLLEARPPIWLRRPGGPPEPSELASVRRTSGGLLVRLPDVGDRDQAAALRGVQVCVSRERFAAAEDDEFYVCDLVGCAALLAGQPVGEVVDVTVYPTCDALVILRPDGSKLEVPMHEDFVAEVRLREGQVELRTVAGLE